MSKSVTIVDYGMGNLWSVRSAVSYLGYNPIISSSRLSNAVSSSLPSAVIFTSVPFGADNINIFIILFASAIFSPLAILIIESNLFVRVTILAAARA